MSAEALQDAPTGAAEAALGSVLPRPFVWVLGFAHPALWLGAAVGAVYLLVAAAALLASGLPASLTLRDLVAQQLTYGIYFAAVPVVIAILVRGVQRDARDLTPLLGGGASLEREALTVSPRAVWLGVGFGLLLALATLWILLGWMQRLPLVAVVFIVVREITIDVAIFAPMAWAVGAALGLSRLTQQRARPELFDPRPFAALARNGARLAAVWLVIEALAMPVLLEMPKVFDEEGRSLAVMVLILAAFSAVALILPCLGAHRVLRSAKRRELVAVRGQIAEARHAREDTRLPGLLAWEARIEGLSEWPIDARALRRTGLFLLLPLASWIGSALVERLVDASLG